MESEGEILKNHETSDVRKPSQKRRDYCLIRFFALQLANFELDL